MDKLQFGIEHSRLLVAFLAAREDWVKGALAPVMRNPRFRIASSSPPTSSRKAAADLSDALLGS